MKPNLDLYDYKTQRASRGFLLGPLTSAIFAYVGAVGGISYSVYKHIPLNYLNELLPTAHGIPIDGYTLYYNIFPFIVPMVKYFHYTAFHELTIATLGSAGLAGLLGYMIGDASRDKARKQILKNQLHGSAHWATEKEVKNAGLTSVGENNCYLGRYIDKKKSTLLTHSGPEHIIALAPTRSGKGVGLVLPTLLEGWKSSSVTHDIKGENYLLTAGYRKSLGHKILKFSPGELDERGCHFNPMEEIRLGTDYEVKDAQNIATMIVDPNGKGLADHWQKTGFMLLTSVIMHVMYAGHDKTLRGVSAFLNNPNLTSVDEAFDEMKQTLHDPSMTRGWVDAEGRPTPVHPAIAQSAQEMINKDEKEKSGVISTMQSFLNLYRDPVVARWTEYSDFRIADLQDAESPVDLYIVTSPEDKGRLRPIIRLLIAQIMARLTASDRLKEDSGSIKSVAKHRLLFLLDEFPSLGKLDTVLDGIAFLAGYGIKLFLIAQDKAQLEDETHGYGKSGGGIILSNCHLKVVYAPNNYETAKWASDVLGTQTIILENESKSIGGMGKAGSSISMQHQSRALLTPDEVARLKGPVKNGEGKILEAGDVIIQVAGSAPVYAQQLLYFKDAELIRRASIPATASDQLKERVLRSIPAAEDYDIVEDVEFDEEPSLDDQVRSVMEGSYLEGTDDSDKKKTATTWAINL